MAFCKSLLLVAHLVSWHAEPGANNENYGGAVECRGSRVSVQAGHFRNSFDRPSTYAVIGYEFWRNDRFGIGAALGPATGYSEYRGPIKIGGVRFRAVIGPLEFGVLGMPRLGDGHGYVHGMVSWKIH